MSEPSDKDEAKNNSHSATHEPWNKPGQTSQNSAQQPPDKSVVEQKKNQKQDL